MKHDSPVDVASLGSFAHDDLESEREHYLWHMAGSYFYKSKHWKWVAVAALVGNVAQAIASWVW